jgi:acyl carrier protein
MTEIEEKLTEYITTQVIKRPHYNLGRDEALISSGLIDSFHLVDLAIFIEETWGVRIDDTELTPATFDTLSQLASLIKQRQA